MDLQNHYHQRYLQYFFLSIVLLVQEKNPWDEALSFLPIAGAFLLLFGNFLRTGKIPKYEKAPLKKGILLLVCGLVCFVKGLDDDNDPFRFFHGMWHAFVGAAAYYNFKVLPHASRATQIPIKKH